MNPPDWCQLLSWFSDVAAAHGLERETFYLAIDLTERFFARHPALPPITWQLVGAGSLLVASKYHDYRHLGETDLHIYTDYAYSVQELCQFEALLGATLDWDFLRPQPVDQLEPAQLRHYDLFLLYRRVARFSQQDMIDAILRRPTAPAGAAYLASRLRRQGLPRHYSQEPTSKAEAYPQAAIEHASRFNQHL